VLLKRSALYVGLSALGVVAVAGLGSSRAVAEEGPARSATSQHHASGGKKRQEGELVRIVRESTARFKDPADAEAEGYQLMFPRAIS
jgi:hypothetical protein